MIVAVEDPFAATVEGAIEAVELLTETAGLKVTVGMALKVKESVESTTVNWGVPGVEDKRVKVASPLALVTAEEGVMVSADPRLEVTLTVLFA